MEKKRSPRSSPGILPKSPLLYEKYKAGCAWRLINFFDFRQSRSGRRLTPDKSRGGFRDSAGNVYTKSQLDLLRRLHEKNQSTNTVNAQRLVGEDEDILRRPKTNRRSSVSGTEHEKFYAKSVRETSNREVRRIKSPKEETFDSLLQAQGKLVFSEQKLSSRAEIEISKKKDDKQLGPRKGPDQSCKNVDQDLAKCQEINLHVRVNEVAEALICQKAKKGKVLGRDNGSERSKQFLEALDVLSSNKELFVNLLQDPNSFSAKCGRELLGSRPKEQEAKCSSEAESFETIVKELGESDDLDRIVLLKPRLTSSGEDSAYLRFKHMAKKLKLVVGSNKNNRGQSKLLRDFCSPEDSCETEATRRKSDATQRMEKTSDESDSRRRSDASTSTIGHRSSELPVFKRKKRVESEVFKLSPEYDISLRRHVVERQHERTSSSPVYEAPHVLSSFPSELDACVSPKMRFKERNQRPGNEKQSHGSRTMGNPKHGSAVYSNLRPNMEDECIEQRYSQSSCEEYCKDSHSIVVETNTLFSDFSSPERSNKNSNDLKQEQEHPSPVSVLERILMEDDSASPGNAKHPLMEEPSLELKSMSERGSVQEFVKTVLETFGLNWTELLAKCSVSTLRSSLLDQFSHSNDHHQRLVIDYTSEVLHETYIHDIESWPFTPLKNPRLAPFALRNDLVRHALKRFDWSLLCDSGTPRTLDQLMEKDLTKPCLWMDWGGETEGVVSDVVELFLEQLEMEIARELRTMSTKIYTFLRD